jgi:membrane associated rhomboid family serine protease
MIPIPVGDTSKTRHTAYVNWLLIVANCAIYAWYGFRQDRYDTTISAYALVPNHWSSHWTTLFTSMFLHGDPMHLLGNMLFLYIAGDNVEDRLGHLSYLVFYIAAGIAGAAAHIVYSTNFGSGGGMPCVGASGAISGVMGAYLVLFPKSQIKFMLWLIIFIRFFTLPAWGVLGFWIASQIMMARNQWYGLETDKQAATVAVFAHLGGFAFGFLVGLFARMFGKAPKKRSD